MLPAMLQRHPIARRLPLAFDPEPLAAELASIDESAWGRHEGPYHDGAWECVALWAPNGDAGNQRTSGGAFAATPVLAARPAMQRALEAFAAPRQRVRLMRLGPGGHILAHSDPIHAHPGLLRLHVPIVTSPLLAFWVGGHRVAMQPGEVWHVDVRFVHEVHNFGAVARVHLVVDLFLTSALEALLARAMPLASGSLAGYFAKHALPAPLRRVLRVGN